MSSISATPIFWVGLDVHKDSVTAAVFRNRDPEPMQVERLPNDHKRIRRYFERLSAAGSPRVCYEASGAGYVLQRALTDWGVACELAAPSLIPRRPGEHQKTDRRDAIKIARDYRDGRQVLLQAAWCYRRRPTVGASLRRRQEGQNPSVIAHAWKCQHRLYKVFHRLAAKKPNQVAATAVARELIGFIWAVLQDIDISRLSNQHAPAEEANAA